MYKQDNILYVMIIIITVIKIINKLAKKQIIAMDSNTKPNPSTQNHSKNKSSWST